MRSVREIQPPGSVADILEHCKQNSALGWDVALSTHERAKIREALANAFERCCAYCGRICVDDECEPDDDDATQQELAMGTIDHFRPRDAETCGRYGNQGTCTCNRQAALHRRRFKHLEFEWSNLYYACYRCNQLKGNCWPVNVLLGNPLAEGFVDPRINGAAEKIFEYHFESGLIEVNEIEMDPEQKQIGRNTIDYMNLNSDAKLFPPPNKSYPSTKIFSDSVKRESNDNDDVLSLPKQRQAAYAAFQLAMESADDQQKSVLCEQVASGQAPFAGFIAAFLMSEASKQ